MTKGPDRPAYAIPVLRAADFTVINGANLGDSISFADELDLDDTYDLRVGARLHRLSLAPATATPSPSWTAPASARPAPPCISTAA